MNKDLFNICCFQGTGLHKYCVHLLSVLLTLAIWDLNVEKMSQRKKIIPKNFRP